MPRLLWGINTLTYFKNGRKAKFFCLVFNVLLIEPYQKHLFQNEHTLPINIEQSFFAKGLSGKNTGKLFIYPWEVKQEKKDHRDRKIENIFF